MSRERIKRYFNLLVKKFVKLGKNSSYKIIFEDNLDKYATNPKFSNIYGNTQANFSQKRVSIWGFYWYLVPRVRYIISFLNNYPCNDALRSAIIHEFAHLYFMVNKIRKEWNENKWKALKESLLSHQHDDEFYAKVDYFENWIDQELNLSPRKNKGLDWIQHINPLRNKER